MRAQAPSGLFKPSAKLRHYGAPLAHSFRWARGTPACQHCRVPMLGPECEESEDASQSR